MSAHKAVEAEPTVVESIVENNRNFHPTNLLDVDAHADSKLQSTATYASFWSRRSNDARSHRRGGGGIFAQALGETFPNRGAAGLLSDVDPRHPNFFVAVAAAVILITLGITLCLVYRKANRRRRWASGRVGAVGGGTEPVAPVSSPVGDVIHNTSIGGRRARTGTAGAEVPPASPKARPSSAGKVRPYTPSRESLRRVPRDAHTSIVPPFGVDVREFQSEEIERQRNKIKKLKEAREAAKAAAAAAGGTSSSPSPRARWAKTRSSNNTNNSSSRTYRDTSPAAGSKGKAPAQSSRSRTTSSSMREKASRQEQVESSRAEPMLSPRNASGKRGGASRPIPSPKSSGPVVKRVAVASEKLTDDMPTTRVLAMTATNIDKRVPSLALASSETSRERRGVTTAAGREPEGGAASSPLSTPFKSEASSLVDTARHDAQLEADSAAKARADKLTDDGAGARADTDDGDGAPGSSRRKDAKRANDRISEGNDDREGDDGKGDTKRGKKRSGAGASDGDGFSGGSPRRSPRIANKRPVDRDGGGDGGQRSTKRATKTAFEGDKDVEGDDGARRGTKRTSTGDIAPVPPVKRAKRNN